MFQDLEFRLPLLKPTVKMHNLSFYHGQISLCETERRLRVSNLVGSFLLRSGTTNVIVSYLDNQLQTQHKFLPRSGANELIKSHRELVGSPEDVFTYLQSLDSIWIYAVDRSEEVRYFYWHFGSCTKDNMGSCSNLTVSKILCLGWTVCRWANTLKARLASSEVNDVMDMSASGCDQAATITSTVSAQVLRL